MDFFLTPYENNRSVISDIVAPKRMDRLQCIFLQYVLIMSGVQEKSNGDREEVDGSHGTRRGHALPGRAAVSHDRDMLPEQLSARGGLRVVCHRTC